MLYRVSNIPRPAELATFMIKLENVTAVSTYCAAVRRQLRNSNTNPNANGLTLALNWKLIQTHAVENIRANFCCFPLLLVLELWPVRNRWTWRQMDGQTDGQETPIARMHNRPQ